MTDQNAPWFGTVRTALAAELAAIGGEWADDGHAILGPGGTSVIVDSRHEAGPGHVDIGVCIDRPGHDTPVVCDCVSGGAGDPVGAARMCARIWAQTTAPVVFELLSREGRFADHSHGDARLGLSSWHSIHGAVLGYGRNDATPLQQWCLDNPPIPMIADCLSQALSADSLHAVKFLLGAFGDESVAEVRINGARHDLCSDALLGLPWPKDPARVCRFFVLFVHRI